MNITDNFLTEYLKIMLAIVSNNSGYIGGQLGRSIPEEEKLRDDFRECILTFSHSEMMVLAKRTVDIALRKLLKNHPDRGYLTTCLLEDTIGLRPSEKYIKQLSYFHPDFDRGMIRYTPQEEEILKKLILKLKPITRDCEQHRLRSLLHKLTGQYFDDI